MHMLAVEFGLWLLTGLNLMQLTRWMLQAQSNGVRRTVRCENRIREDPVRQALPLACTWREGETAWGEEWFPLAEAFWTLLAWQWSGSGWSGQRNASMGPFLLTTWILRLWEEEWEHSFWLISNHEHEKVEWDQWWCENVEIFVEF